MLTLTRYVLPLIGLFFLVLGMGFLIRARSTQVSPITARTRRKLGLIYLCAGAVLTLWGIIRS